MLHSVAHPIPLFMLLLRFTMLASEDVNIGLLLIYPVVDSAHDEASASMWKNFWSFSSKPMNEML